MGAGALGKEIITWAGYLVETLLCRGKPSADGVAVSSIERDARFSVKSFKEQAPRAITGVRHLHFRGDGSDSYR